MRSNCEHNQSTNFGIEKDGVKYIKPEILKEIGDKLVEDAFNDNMKISTAMYEVTGISENVRTNNRRF